MRSNIQGALLALLSYGIYSTHDVIIKHLGGTYSPFQIIFFSVIFGFPLVSFMLIRDTTAENLRPRHPWWTALRTAAILISSACLFYAFSVLPLAQTYSIIFSVPLIITLLSIPVLGERVGLHRGAAVVVGLIGVLIVVRPGESELSLGHFAAFVGSFFSSLAAIIVRKIGNDERNVVLLLFPMLASFLIMGGVMPFYYQPMPLADLGLMVLLAVLGFVALNFLIAAYKAGEAAVVATMLYSQIIWASIFGYLIFNESFDLHTLIGAMIVIASGLYVVLRENLKDNSKNTPVLQSRSRIAAGINFSIGTLLRLSKSKREKR